MPHGVGPTKIVELSDGSILSINLSGRSGGCRYDDANRQEIWGSRVRTTRALTDAVRAASAPPRLSINAGTTTIYRHSMDRPETEEGEGIGDGFSVDVAKAWETGSFAGSPPTTRRVALRSAIVLGDGAALTMLDADVEITRLITASAWSSDISSVHGPS